LLFPLEFPSGRTRFSSVSAFKVFFRFFAPRVLPFHEFCLSARAMAETPIKTLSTLPQVPTFLDLRSPSHCFGIAPLPQKNSGFLPIKADNLLSSLFSIFS